MSAQKKDTLKKFDWIAKKDTSIIGKAANAKAGAVIITLDEQTYYIDGVTSWSDKLNGKILKVKGKLAERSYGEERKPGEPIVQTMEGKMTCIVKATWGVIKK
ncbi:MAG: hypothetical protein IAF38_03895 [Bacteroidia bacterium]|nr:hypothetical protein [Bacteroidia bacterium]